MSSRPKHLLLPQGTAGLFLQDARRYQRATDDFFALCHTWGYQSVHSPLLDYEEAYAPLLDHHTETKAIRMVDRDGKVLLLRPDNTLFLIKNIHSLLSTGELPLRIAYADTVFRHEDPLDFDRDEYYQLGAELLGVESSTAELEAMLMARQSLMAIGLADFRFHVGSSQLFRALVSNLDRDESADMDKLRTMASLRNWSELREELESLWLGEEEGELNPEAQKTIEGGIQLLQIIGPSGEVAKAVEKLAPSLPEEVVQAAAGLCATVADVADHCGSDEFVVDFSELGSLSVHDGLVFRVYGPDSDAPWASGGRYDSLPAFFGVPVAAVGFTISLSKIIQASREHKGEVNTSPVDHGTRQSFWASIKGAGLWKEDGYEG